MDSRPVRIFSDEDSPRLKYIAGIILGDILGLQWEIITDRRKLRKHAVINYSTGEIPGSFIIFPDRLLFEKDIHSREIAVTTWKSLPVFFAAEGESDFPFDIFAASFWLVTRYEEYLEHDPDEHGRYRASSSLAFRNGFLGLPVVDLWVKELARSILKKFPTLAFRRSEFRSILTIDTDQPFAYLGKGLLRSIGGVVNGITKNTGSVSMRYKVVTQGVKDPYDVFDYLGESIEKLKPEVRIFFPVGDLSRFDKNPSWKNSDYRKLIMDLSSKYETGLHPSYLSASELTTLQAEAGRLNDILDKNVTISRFHFIRIFIPESYRRLLAAGIKEDYSMGYPEETGFRAGIARPFWFYDLGQEKQTELRVFPFQVMDGTLFDYRKLTPEAAMEEISRLIAETRRAGGLFISIWHNTSLLDDDKWRDWRGVFEFMLKNQVYDSVS